MATASRVRLKDAAAWKKEEGGGQGTHMHSWGDIKDKKEERRVTVRCVCHPTLQKTVKMPKKGRKENVFVS